MCVIAISKVIRKICYKNWERYKQCFIIISAYNRINSIQTCEFFISDYNYNGIDQRMVQSSDKSGKVSTISQINACVEWITTLCWNGYKCIALFASSTTRVYILSHLRFAFLCVSVQCAVCTCCDDFIRCRPFKRRRWRRRRRHRLYTTVCWTKNP